MNSVSVQAAGWRRLFAFLWEERPGHDINRYVNKDQSVLWIVCFAQGHCGKTLIITVTEVDVAMADLHVFVWNKWVINWVHVDAVIYVWFGFCQKVGTLILVIWCLAESHRFTVMLADLNNYFGEHSVTITEQ